MMNLLLTMLSSIMLRLQSMPQNLLLYFLGKNETGIEAITFTCIPPNLPNLGKLDYSALFYGLLCSWTFKIISLQAPLQIIRSCCDTSVTTRVTKTCCYTRMNEEWNKIKVDVLRNALLSRK